MHINILIIDDDKSFKRILEIRLKSLSINTNVINFDSLSEAREYLKQADDNIDLVILDQHLPDGLGVDFLHEGLCKNTAVVIVSSDDAPEIPGASVQAGAAYFLSKKRVSEPLFKPLIQGIIERNKLENELRDKQIQLAIMENIKTMLSTLRHEINNPLGAVLGAAYLLKTYKLGSEEQKEAAQLVESSGKRIKHVLEKLCETVSLEPVTKANQKVFHVPGDKPWE